jgi:lambda family phage portal protein
MATRKKKDAAPVVANKEANPVDTTANAPRRKRGWEAARYQPTLGFLPTLFQDFQQELKNDAKNLRVRARDASLNNIYARTYLKSLVQNVIGPYGINLKMTIKNPNGTPDEIANYMLEQRWKEFGKKVTVDGKSLRELLKTVIETVPRDGEIFLVMRKGTNFGPYLLNVQCFESEYCDQEYNEVSTDGTTVINQGIEYDYYGRPVAYHLWKFAPNSVQARSIGHNERIRIPADEVLHIYSKERVSQGRGFPWLSAALISLSHITEYTKSELIASRVASAKMGFIYRPKGSEETVGDYEDSADPGSFIDESVPGSFSVLPEGWQVQEFDPQNPNASYPQFIKAVLEGVAASLGIAYHTLSGDLSSANYSSLRQGALAERETFKECQQWLIESLLQPLFEAWLTNVLAFSLEGVRLPISKFSQFNQTQWRPRVYPWVDPAKDMAATVAALEQNIRSRTEVCESLGRDFDDVIREIAAENELAKSLGVTIEPTQEGAVNAALVAAIVGEAKPNTDDGSNPKFE